MAKFRSTAKIPHIAKPFRSNNILFLLSKISIMEGILYVVDEHNNRRFVQIDLDKHGEIREDFYDLLIVMSRKTGETLSSSALKDR